MYKNDICFICLETCKKPGVLDLNCECDYIVHKKCFDKWYMIQKNCIICHKKCNPIRKHGTVIMRRNINNSNINIRINHNGYNGVLFWAFLFLFFRLLSMIKNNDTQNNNTFTLEN